MNILYVASDNNRISGAFLSLVKLNEILSRDFGVKTFVVLPNEGDGNQLLDEIGVACEVVPSRNWVVDIEEGKTEEREKEKEKELLGNTSAIDRICELIREKKIDLLHINTSYSYVGAEAARREKIPFVWHIREFLEEGQQRKIWNRSKGYELIGKADAIAVISDSLYEKYGKIFPAGKVHTIYNGIEEREFYNPQKEIFQEKIVQFGIIGGVVPYKGHEELIRACGTIKEQGFSDFRLHIIGKGKDWYRDFLRKLVEENNLQDNVIFAGASNDIPEVLRSLDILFVCSRNEAFGRTTVEGMMSGCLVIGANTAGTKELLENGKNGYLYKQGDVDSLVHTIKRVLRHYREGSREEAEKIRQNGQMEAMKKYTALRNAEEILKLYREIEKKYILQG